MNLEAPDQRVGSFYITVIKVRLLKRRRLKKMEPLGIPRDPNEVLN